MKEYSAEEYAALSSIDKRELFVLKKLFGDQKFTLEDWDRQRAKAGLS